MTLDRFDPRPVLRGQVKGLTDGRVRGYQPDWVARLIVAAPLLLVVPAQLWGWTLLKPDAILAGVSLLAGALIGSFGFLATLRLRLLERQVGFSDEPDAARDGLDESVAHLLAATLACVLDAVVLVLGMNVSADSKGAVTGIWAALAIALSGYVAVVFFMLVVRLYSAYVQAVRPRANLDGTIKGHR